MFPNARMDIESIEADDSEEKIEKITSIHYQRAISEIHASNAQTNDIEAQTNLKIILSFIIAGLMILTFVFQVHAVSMYMFNMLESGKEIPVEVIVGVLAISSSVVTLMGFILKGLFQTKDG